MKQGNYLQALNCTLKIKDRGSTSLGGGEIKISLQEVHCNIHQADRPLNAALPGLVRAVLAAGAVRKRRLDGGEQEPAGERQPWSSQVQGGAMGAQEKAPPGGSYVRVTTPWVWNGRDSGFAGIQMTPGFGPGTRTAPAAMAKERKGISLPLRLCCRNHFTLRGPRQRPTNPVALGGAEPTQPPHPGTPKPTFDPPRLPPHRRPPVRGTQAQRSHYPADTGALSMFLWQRLFFFFPTLSFECSNHQ